MKKFSFIAGVSAIALAATSILPAISAYAQTATYDGGNDSVELVRYINDTFNPVTNTFTYTITPGSDNPATVTGMPTTETIVFNNAQPNQDAVMGTKTIDLSGLNFTAVGDYVWTVAETASTDSINYPVSDETQDINISVRYVVDNNNVPTGAYVAYLKDNQLVWDEDAERSFIGIEASTTGNLADTSKCFEYTLTIGEDNGDVYDIAYVPEAGGSCTNPSQITSGVPTTIRLKHGDTMMVGYIGGHYELPIGLEYTLVKDDTSDGYTNTMSMGDTNYTNEISGTTSTEENAISIINNKEADPVTGIVTSAWFYIILLAIGAFGLFFFIIARRRNDDEEQQAE